MIFSFTKLLHHCAKVGRLPALRLIRSGRMDDRQPGAKRRKSGRFPPRLQLLRQAAQRTVHLHPALNPRAASVKQLIFEAIADKLTQNPGLRREDIIMNIVEPAPENWWIEGREINPRTGTDTRIKG